MLLTYQEYVDTNLNGKIPIFRTGNQPLSDLHQDIKELYKQTLYDNPDYIIVYFLPYERREFISEYYPQYLETYDKLIPGAYQADLFRLLIVYKHGGVWADFSMKFLIPINDIVNLKEYKLVVAIDPNYFGLFNGFFAAQPELGYLLYIAERIKENVNNKYYGECDTDPTGPMCWGRVMNKLLGRNEKTSFYGYIHKDIKIYKLSIYDFFSSKWNGYIHEVGKQNFIIQHKLSYFTNFGLYTSSPDYHTLWRQGKIYK